MNLAALGEAEDSAADPAFVHARALQVDRWPARWHALAPETRRWTLDTDTVQALGRQSAGYGDWFAPCSPEPLRTLAVQLDEALAALGGKGMVRLNSRSPKDSLRAQLHGLGVRSGAAALALFLSGSRRCASDLRQALARRTAVQMVVRRWLDIAPGREFRCFIEGRRWVGTSGTRPSGAVPADEAVVLAALRPVMQQIIAASPVPDAAFDLAWVSPPDAPAGAAPQVLLLDANPLRASTDRGAYVHPDGQAMPFDGGLRYGADGASVPAAHGWPRACCPPA